MTAECNALVTARRWGGLPAWAWGVVGGTVVGCVGSLMALVGLALTSS